jgi:tRNA threonylcarbamoyladenosine biosynthesis protein TsaE
MGHMSTATTCAIVSTGSENTEKLGEQLGRALKGGETIELVSDLGGGKTTFVRGLARGIGSSDKVASPTFTISRLYKSDKLELHHFDFYRLPDAGLMAHELAEALHDPKVVLLVEWADVIRHVLPEKRLTIRFTNAGEDTRRLEIHCPGALHYLIEDIC